MNLPRVESWVKLALPFCQKVTRVAWRYLRPVWNFAYNCEVGLWLRAHIFTAVPNLPKLIGDGIGVLGVLFLLLALKEDWYTVPQYFIHAEDGSYSTSNLTSPWEKRLKLLLMGILPITAIAFFIFRKRVFLRTKIQGNFAAIILLISFLFCQVTVINEGELSKIAAMHVTHHDNLTWYGGDITTSRGQEVYGNGVDYIAKELPLIVAPVPIPYESYDLATFQDFLQWSGMCATFWNYFKKGWGFLSLSGIFILISAVCVRLDGEQKGLGSEVVSYVLKRAAIILICWYGAIFIRTQWCSHTLERARDFHEQRDIENSLASLNLAGRIMPSVHWDSSVVYQRGSLEKDLGLATPGAALYEGFLFERQRRMQAASRKFIEVIEQEKDRPSQIEAYRALMRLSIEYFNSDERTKCNQTLAVVENEFPTLMKILFLRFMMAVRNGDYHEALEWQKKLYASSGQQQMKDRRGYLATTHQYLAQMAFDNKETVTSWQHNIFRQELNGDGAKGMPELAEE